MGRRPAQTWTPGTAGCSGCRPSRLHMKGKPSRYEWPVYSRQIIDTTVEVGTGHKFRTTDQIAFHTQICYISAQLYSVIYIRNNSQL